MRSLLAATGLLGSLAAASGAPEPTWVVEAPPSRPTHVARSGERAWLGTERGLYALRAGDLELVLAHEAVRDLAPVAEGLWVASERALYFVAPGAEPERVALGAGARPSALAVDASGRVLLASDAGLFVRAAEGGEFRRAAGLPAGPVEAVRVHGASVFAATRGIVWQEREAEHFAPRLRSLDDGWWELRAVERAGDALLLAVPRGIWRLEGDDAARTELGLGELRDLCGAGGLLYVASARGVFALPQGELERAAPRLVVEREALDLWPEASALLAATPQGIVEVEAPGAGDALPFAAQPEDPERAFRALLAGEPGIERVQRAVLAYLELAPSRMRALDERAARMGWWPELRLGLGYDFGRAGDRDRDAVLSSGVIHDLFDSSRTRESGMDLSLTFEWQLAELASPDSALAVSKERRELIELRDQVLERVSRLYFERHRVLARLAAQGASGGAERRELEIRAAELAAQLDAWTGGTFGRLRQSSPTDSGRSQ
jgi:hypothetical protein